jgi:hypothetical protein
MAAELIRRRRSRLDESWLAPAVVIGSLGILAAPLGCLWLAAHLGGSDGLGVAVLGAPTALVLWALALGRINRRYLRVSRHPRPVLELSVTAVVVVAVAGTLIWMLMFGAGGPDVPLRTS